MITNIAAQILALQVAVDASIMDGRRMMVPTWESVALKKIQATSTGLFAWMNDLPLIAKKQSNGYIRGGISTQAFSLISEPYGLFIEMKKRAFKDAAATGDIARIVEVAKNLGIRIEQFPQDLVWGWFKEGDQTTYLGSPNLAFDGLSFFNDAHYTNGRNTAGGTYDNNITGTALTAANIAVAEGLLALIPDNNGKPLNQPLTDIIVPPQLRQTAVEALRAPVNASGATNMLSPEERAKNGFSPINIVSVPELSGDSTTWYAVSRANGRAPVIYQETEAFRVIPMLEENMPNVLYDDLYIWAAKGEVAAGWGDPRTALRLIA